jgi:hypothetical protein
MAELEWLAARSEADKQEVLDRLKDVVLTTAAFLADFPERRIGTGGWWTCQACLPRLFSTVRPPRSLFAESVETVVGGDGGNGLILSRWMMDVVEWWMLLDSFWIWWSGVASHRHERYAPGPGASFGLCSGRRGSIRRLEPHLRADSLQLLTRHREPVARAAGLGAQSGLGRCALNLGAAADCHRAVRSANVRRLQQVHRPSQPEEGQGCIMLAESYYCRSNRVERGCAAYGPRRACSLGMTSWWGLTASAAAVS